MREVRGEMDEYERAAASEWPSRETITSSVHTF